MGGAALGAAEAALASGQLSSEGEARLRTALKYIRPRAATDEAARVHAAWDAQMLHGAFQKSGHANPACDAAVHEALDLYLKFVHEPVHADGASRAAALEAFQAAVAKGCDDPLVLCLKAAADGRTNEQGWGGEIGRRTGDGGHGGRAVPARGEIVRLRRLPLVDQPPAGRLAAAAVQAFAGPSQGNRPSAA